MPLRRRQIFSTLRTFAVTSLATLASFSIAHATALPLPTQSDKTPNTAPLLMPPAPSLKVKSYVLMDSATGSVLASFHKDAPLPPASLTKLMTLHLTFQALNAHQINLDSLVPISEKAWRMGGSRMFLKEGTQVPVSDLIDGIIVASGNDACVAVAEYIAGNETNFAEMMNQTAKQLTMNHSHFVDSTGLPNAKHYSTAYDLALLTRSIITSFPQYYPEFAKKWIKYNGIKQPNRNRLLWRDKNVDGLKTGHTKAAGFCLIASGKQEDTRLIAVVMGADSDSARASDTQALLNYGFRYYQTYELFPSNKPLVEKRVFQGEHGTVGLGLAQHAMITIPKEQYKSVTSTVKIDTPLRAPIKKGKTYGTLTVSLKDKTLLTTPIIALTNDPKGGLWTRMTDSVSLLMHRWFGGES